MKRVNRDFLGRIRLISVRWSKRNEINEKERGDYEGYGVTHECTYIHKRYTHTKIFEFGMWRGDIARNGILDKRKPIGKLVFLWLYYAPSNIYSNILLTQLFMTKKIVWIRNLWLVWKRILNSTNWPLNSPKLLSKNDNICYEYVTIGLNQYIIMMATNCRDGS